MSSGGAGRRDGNPGKGSGAIYGGAAKSNIRLATQVRDKDSEHAFDARMGYERVESGEDRVGYLFNMLPTTISCDDRHERSAIDMYFIQQDGETFKATMLYEPYFYVALAAISEDADSFTREVISILERRYEGLINSIKLVEKEDLEMLNHLSGRRREYLKLSFRSVGELMTVRSQLRPIIEKNHARAAAVGGDFMEMVSSGGAGVQRRGSAGEPREECVSA